MRFCSFFELEMQLWRFILVITVDKIIFLGLHSEKGLRSDYFFLPILVLYDLTKNLPAWYNNWNYYTSQASVLYIVLGLWSEKHAPLSLVIRFFSLWLLVHIACPMVFFAWSLVLPFISLVLGSWSLIFGPSWSFLHGPSSVYIRWLLDS